ncbi:hypothetical protein BGW41_002932 [Actinomortierella wolfii]|nr:hypothetical protein BGW41_002932 [Actinomortierella wolfii]
MPDDNHVVVLDDPVDIPLHNIVVSTAPVPDELPPSYSYDNENNLPPPSPTQEEPATVPNHRSSGQLHLVTPRWSTPLHGNTSSTSFVDEITAAAAGTTASPPPPTVFSAQGDVLPNYLDATCDSSGIPWSLPTTGCITFTILPHRSIPFQQPLTNFSTVAASPPLPDARDNETNTSQGTGEAGGETIVQVEEGEEELEVFAQQRIRQPRRNRRTDLTQTQQQHPPEHRQQTHDQGHVPDHTQQQVNPTATSLVTTATTTTTAATTITTTTTLTPEATTTTTTATITIATDGDEDFLMETVLMCRAGQWMFEYWIEDAVMYMNIPVKPKPAPQSSTHERPYLQGESNVHRSYESLSDMPTPAPLAAPAEPLGAFGVFRGGSALAAEIARTSSPEYSNSHRRGSRGIMSQTFGSSFNLSPISSREAEGHRRPPPIPSYANLFALVSASDPQQCIWRTTCFGDNIERCPQLSTLEDIRMWWRERIEQHHESEFEVEHHHNNNHQRTDIEAATQATASSSSQSGSNGESGDRLVARLGRAGRRFATRTRDIILQTEYRDPPPPKSKKKKKKRPFFDRRDWEHGIVRGFKTMLIKIGIREIPDPHNETLELALRLRGLYYCWREVTHTHLDSDDDEDIINDDNTFDNPQRSPRSIYSNNMDNSDTTTGDPAAASSSSSGPHPSPHTSPRSTHRDLSVRGAIQRARNMRQMRGRGKGHARMFVFDRDDTMANDKRVRGMIMAEVWIGHDDLTPEEAEEERQLEAQRRRRLQGQSQSRWANAITGLGRSDERESAPTTTTITTSSQDPARGNGGSGDANVAELFPPTLKRRRCMLRVRQGLSVEVESFILATAPRLPELYEVFDQSSYHPRINRCRFVLYITICITIFVIAFFARIGSWSESPK